MTLADPPIRFDPLIDLRRLINELSDLKRITSARFDGSLASHRFGGAIAAMREIADRSESNRDADTALDRLARDEVAAAIIATRGSAMDVEALVDLGVDRKKAFEFFLPALREHLDDDAIAALRLDDRKDDAPQRLANAGEGVQEFCRRMIAEPRSGATAIGKSRVLVTPTESHADHCYLTAVTASLFCLLDPNRRGWMGQAFVAGMLHHAHNAVLPDGGFAGELMLGDDLPTIIAAARSRAIAMLGHTMAPWVHSASQVMTHVEDDLSQVVNAADAVDRVMQTRYHEQVATFDADDVCRRLELVHAGPLQSFQQSALRQLGLA